MFRGLEVAACHQLEDYSQGLPSVRAIKMCLKKLVIKELCCMGSLDYAKRYVQVWGLDLRIVISSMFQVA